jgi:hypothetical protein
MSGFAQIPEGSRGTCTNTFDFTGASGQSSYALSLPGPREGAFTLSADPDVVSWSPCGGTTAIMNMNTQCNISPTQSAALIAVGSTEPPSVSGPFDPVMGKIADCDSSLKTRSTASAARSRSTSRSSGASARGRAAWSGYLRDEYFGDYVSSGMRRRSVLKTRVLESILFPCQQLHVLHLAWTRKCIFLFFVPPPDLASYHPSLLWRRSA